MRFCAQLGAIVRSTTLKLCAFKTPTLKKSPAKKTSFK